MIFLGYSFTAAKKDRDESSEYSYKKLKYPNIVHYTIDLEAMQNTIKVFTPAEFLTAAKEAEAAGKPVLTISKKGGKDADKKYKGGTQFLDVKWHGLGGTPKAAGWFSLNDIPIQAIPDPAKKRPGTEDNKPQISAKVSNLGDFGTALLIAQKHWVAAVKVLEDSKAIPKRKVHDLAQMTISESATENAGAALEDPIFRGKIADYGENFPATYPVAILANKPKTEIYDYRTGRVVDGKPVYELATVEDESGKRVPVSHANLHKFVTAGSVLRYGRLMATSVAVSGNWTSLQFSFTKLIIEPGAAAVFADDDDIPLPAAVKVTPASTVASPSAVAPASTHVDTPAEALPTPPAAGLDEISAALAGL
jgi:hypothetical protein